MFNFSRLEFEEILLPDIIASRLRLEDCRFLTIGVIGILYKNLRASVPICLR